MLDIYQFIGSVKPHSVKTLAQVVKRYGPWSGATTAQVALRKRALAELTHRAAQGRQDAQAVLREYMGPYKPLIPPSEWREGIDYCPNTGFPL
jgi:hypothetical protein